VNAAGVTAAASGMICSTLERILSPERTVFWYYALFPHSVSRSRSHWTWKPASRIRLPALNSVFNKISLEHTPQLGGTGTTA